MNLMDLFIKIGVDDQASSGIQKISASTVAAGQLMADAITGATKKLVEFGKQSIESYAEYEQLVGGIETLFGAGGLSLDEYAKKEKKTVDAIEKEYKSLEKSQSKVMRDAAEAYRTAGLSANEYLETVMSFSASLKQSLEGDTEAVAEYANKAVIDMADNANKMGTSIESIQNAYQGFAKQNYTMLDNLKLGYGGTQAEMQRLIADAAKLSETVDAQSMSFANVVEAVHVVQTELGITGTTAKEAGATISGSLGSMKAAWENLIVGIADENADIEKLFEDLVVSIAGDGTESNKGVIGNLLPRIKQTFLGIGDLIKAVSPQIGPAANSIVDEIVKKLENPDGLFSFLDGASAIIGGIIANFEDDNLIERIGNGALNFIIRFTEWLKDDEKLQKLGSGAIAIVGKLGSYISENAGDIAVAAVDLLKELAGGFFSEENIKKFGSTAVDIIKKLGTSISENAKEIGQGVGSIISEFTNGAWYDAGKSIGSEILRGIGDSLKGLGNLIKGEMLYGYTTNFEILGLIDEEKAEKNYEKAGEQMMQGGAWFDFIEGMAEGLRGEYKPSPLPEGFDPSNSALFGGMKSGSAPYIPDGYEEIEDLIGSFPTTGAANAIASSFAGNGVPAGDSIQVNLSLDGEDLASVLIDPLNRKARQRGVNAFA